MIKLVGEYTRLENRGGDWWGCCPFHNEKTPSFHVRPDKKTYHCFGCGKGGGLINFCMEMEKLDFMEAVLVLAKKAGVEVIYEGGGAPDVVRDDTKEQLIDLYKRVAGTFHFLLTSSDMGKSVLEYLAERGVSSDMIEQFGIGFSPADRRWLYRFLTEKGYSSEFLGKSGLFSKKYPEVSFFSNRLMFPIQDRRGQTVAFGGRILDGEGPKYLNSGEMIQYKKGETLFAFHLALPEVRTEKSIILCEGYMDVIAWHQAGIRRAVAPLGTALTEGQVQLISSFADTVFLSFDSDEAGQKATEKAVLLCRKAGLTVKIIAIVGGKDPADVLLNQGADALHDILKNAIIDLEYLLKLHAQKSSMDTIEGKTKAALALFPYISSLSAGIQRESSLNRVAQYYALSPAELQGDFRHYTDYGSVPEKVREDPGKPIRKTAEVRAMLASVSNSEYFTLMRSTLTSDDFEDSAARDLFIITEECYRNDDLTPDSILSRCTGEGLRRLVTETIVSGEFVENSEQTIEDSIRLIKRNSLERRRNRIVNKIRQNRGITLDETQTLHSLIAEKMSIDEEFIKLKDVAHDRS
jgi:DNA primase